MAARKDASRTTPPRRRLGRGLTSLISTEVPIPAEAPADAKAPEASTTAEAKRASRQTPATTVEPKVGGPDEPGGIRVIPTSQIRPNPGQPRQRFDEASLRELGASMRSVGVMQPVAVRPDAAGGFELVVGERRWRAAQLVGISQLPAVVREMDDETAAEWALVENIQREDLSPLERASAFRNLSDRFGLTHQDIADRVGLSRSAVTNQLRLLELDDLSKDLLAQGLLSEGHARALLSITNLDARQRLAQMAVRKEWSVRTLENRAASLAPARRRVGKASTAASPHRADLERRLSDHLGTKVQIQTGKQKGSGRLVIEFYSIDQFEGLMQKLGFSTAEL